MACPADLHGETLPFPGLFWMNVLDGSISAFVNHLWGIAAAGINNICIVKKRMAVKEHHFRTLKAGVAG